MAERLYLDFESYSATDIASCGSFKYMEDPGFEILLLAYAFDDEPVRVVDICSGESWPKDFLGALTDPEITKVAHNAAFERYAIKRALDVYSPPEEWFDTMHLAAQCGLPLSLDGVGKALDFDEDQAKMKEGKALIRYFCVPCKPTKVNGKRTRNLPEHEPEKWETFKEYCRRDVETERLIFHTLEHWMPSDIERKFWCLDARINEKGMRVDLPLVRHAIEMDALYKAELTEKAVAISGMENPNSVAQIKKWLYEQEGVTVTSLNKKVVADVVKELSTDKAKEFMAIRSRLAKSSTKKYEAMERSVCEDGTVKGCFQFYGATRTGRFSGRLVQLQNLYRNEMSDLAVARSLVRDNDYETVRLLYDDVSTTLSELIRTALIPEPGCRWIVADFSAIEARVIAWIAGEEWRLETFRNGGDIYCASASQMFHVPVVKHGINGELRQKGKVAELACIAENELVLTDFGLVPIKNVTKQMRVWDGSSWVRHDGVVCNGIKEVIEYDGLKATADHLVWVEGEPRPIHFGVAAARGLHLLRSESCREAVRLGGDHIGRGAKTLWLSRLLRSHPLHGLRIGAVDKPWESDAGRKQGMSGVLAETTDPRMAGQETDRRKAEVREPELPGVQELRSQRNSLRLRERNSRWPLDDRESRSAGPQNGNRQDRHERKLRARKSQVGDTFRKLLQHAANRVERVRCAVLAVLIHHGDPQTQCGVHPRGDHRAGGARCVRAPEKLARYCGPTRVYDIRNAGPHHRFTVSGVLVHNCGYGGGVNALRQFGADKLGMTDEEMVETIDNWRAASPNIVALWRTLEKAAARCIVHRTPQRAGKTGILFEYENGTLWMTLPSRRRIAYFDARYETSKFHPDRRAISYMGIEQKTKKWARIETYGGRLTENCVQATARDCLRDVMLKLDAAGFDIRAHVHDEVLLSVPEGEHTVEEVCDIMGEELPWAPGLPLHAEGYSCSYYKKD